MFFDWFELHYVYEHHISYPFASIKHACPITSRSKTPIWNLTSGPTVEFDHPPLRNIQITHNNQTVDAAPYKLPSDDTLSNTKHIINQNNFTNTNLNTLGKQLTRLEKHIQRTTINPIGTKTSNDLKLKKPSLQTLSNYTNKPNTNPRKPNRFSQSHQNTLTTH
jgi:hypothetical protein